MSDEDQVKELVAKAIAWSGRLDIWVNNAAKFVFGAATTATDAGKTSMPCTNPSFTYAVVWLLIRARAITCSLVFEHALQTGT